MRLAKFLIFLCFLFTAFSCSEDTPEPEVPEKPIVMDEITLEKADYESLLFTHSTNEKEIRFKTAGVWKVEIPSEVTDWLLVSPTTGDKGSSLMNIKVQANENYDNRAAEITLISGTKRQVITVNQMQKDALVIAKPSYTVGPDGEILTVELGHNVDFDVHIDAYWITSVSSRSYQKTNLCFNIIKNPNHSNREGGITISSKDGKIKQEIKVYQSAQLGLAVSEREKTFDSKEHTFDVQIKSNVEYTVTDPQVTWLHRVESRALTSRTLRYQVDASEDVEGRSAQILLASTDGELKDTVTVIQMQKNALVVAKPNYEINPKGEEIQIAVGHNVGFTCEVLGDWITQIQPATRAYVTDSIKFKISPNVKLEDREGTITFTSVTDSIVQKVNLVQKCDIERKALNEFFQTTKGEQWNNKTNWCTESPLNEWYGIKTNDEGHVISVLLPNNNLQGTFPESFQYISSLQNADFSNNKGLIGMIPSVISQMPLWKTDWPMIVNGTKLETEGTIFPAPEFSVKTITGTEVTNDIYTKNKLTALLQFKMGSSESAQFIPIMLDLYDKCHKQGLDVLGISFDDIQTTVDHINKSKMLWNVFCYHDNETGYKHATVNDKTPLLHLVNQDGKVVFSSVTHDLSKLKSFLGQYFDLSVEIRPLNEELFGKLIYNHKKYPNRWVFEGDKPSVINFYSKDNVECQNLDKTLQSLAQEYEGKVDFYKVDVDAEPGLYKMMTKDETLPCLFVMSNNGDPKSLNGITDEETIREYIEVSIARSIYVSTDYSADGKVVQLQKATKGNGIDIVLMGDAYSDRQIASGEYEKDMKFAYEKFFTEEPYTSFRDFFNVYYIAAVSKNEGYHAGGKSALDCWFSLGTQVGGNDGRCMNYTLNAIPYEKMDEVSIVVVMNSSNYAGTCWMFGAKNQTDYASGTTISYFPKGKDSTTFEQLLHHELGGHGFAKLADEYVSTSTEIPSNVVNSYKQNEVHGWWKNIDFTNDPNQVKWSRFLSDHRYQNEELGMFEGGATYGKGIWHPSENNIMIGNTGGFNAPSREAIYFRIHKLAYGPEWQYNYEDFVMYDQRNLKKTKSRSVDAHQFKPTHRPVVVNKTWQEVMEGACD